MSDLLKQLNKSKAQSVQGVISRNLGKGMFLVLPDGGGSGVACDGGSFDSLREGDYVTVLLTQPATVVGIVRRGAPGKVVYV